MVQIDGLSRTQLEYALKTGRMPFLKSLLEKEHYETHSFYSGLPSSTSAVQGELFYGVRSVVPAFGFRDHQTGKLERMFARDIASDVQAKLESQGEGLLIDGSSYCNIYSGGANEVHYCASSFGWDEFIETISPFRLVLVLVLHLGLLIRTLALMMIEFILATIDFVKGVSLGRRFWQELIMIPARVVVVVLLRELSTIGAGNDAARGLPIIHLNLLGYDEQAQRRGPGSRYAHWSLRGIDSSIRRLWKAAHRGAGREYDFWVYSDHGQQTTSPYQLKQGKLIQQVVAETAGEIEAASSIADKKLARIPSRANWLGFGWLVRFLIGEQDYDTRSRSPVIQTVTSGSMGLVYFLNSELKQRRHEIARRLVRDQHVPMAVFAQPKNQATVITAQGEYNLPSDAIQVFGADHPFLDDVTEDLIRLCQHSDAGDILLLGWTHRIQSTSFVLQNGAHTGPGIEETKGFALMPCDAPIVPSIKRYLRPMDLRVAAQRFLHRDRMTKPFQSRWEPPKRQLRVLTYNVHACVGMDGQLSPERIARVISQTGANIICLQELDVFRERSGNLDQAHEIAKHLEMEFHFHPAWHIEEERFGNSILTRFPMRKSRGRGLHHYKEGRSRRGALWVEIDVEERISLQLITAHLSLYPKEQLLQATELVDQWIKPASQHGPIVLCGDFNARPNNPAYKAINQVLWDVESFDEQIRPAGTYFSPRPVARLDHIFVSGGLQVKNCQVISTRLAKSASDHLPLMTDLRIPDSPPDQLLKNENVLMR